MSSGRSCGEIEAIDIVSEIDGRHKWVFCTKMKAVLDQYSMNSGNMNFAKHTNAKS